MKYGFKTKAERLALQVRKDLGLQDIDPLSARRLAGHLGYQVVRPSGIDGLLPDVEERMSGDACGWSACVLSGGEVQLILYNPKHSPARQESSLMHELGHLLCGHASTAFDFADGLALRRFVKDQEDEAAWLGGCLQVPRSGLAHHIRRRRTPEEVADHFAASLDMVWYRYRVTGLARQLGSWTRN